MKNLILINCFHLHGSSIKFPFLFLSFVVFHGPGLMYWWELMPGLNYVTDVTYIIYHFQDNFDSFKWAVSLREETVLPFGTSHSYSSYTEQNNIASSFVTINIMITNSRFTEFVSCWIYSCILCSTTHILDHSLYCESIKLCLNSFCFSCYLQNQTLIYSGSNYCTITAL